LQPLFFECFNEDKFQLYEMIDGNLNKVSARNLYEYLLINQLIKICLTKHGGKKDNKTICQGPNLRLHIKCKQI
jgi:hypothetical protein